MLMCSHKTIIYGAIQKKYPEYMYMSEDVSHVFHKIISEYHWY